MSQPLSSPREIEQTNQSSVVVEQFDDNSVSVMGMEEASIQESTHTCSYSKNLFGKERESPPVSGVSDFLLNDEDNRYNSKHGDDYGTLQVVYF